METKLTLRLEDKLIKQAKTHAEMSGRSVSRLVADFFSVINQTDVNGAATTAEPGGEPPLPPITRSLLGILGNATSADDKGDYRRHLDEKYR